MRQAKQFDDFELAYILKLAKRDYKNLQSLKKTFRLRDYERKDFEMAGEIMSKVMQMGAGE